MSGAWIAAFVVLWVVVVLLVFVVLGLLRRVSGVLEGAEMRLRSSPMSLLTGGLAIGEVVEAFSLTDAAGKPVRSDALLAGGAVLVFMEHNCEPCQVLATSLREQEEARFVRPVLVVLDEAERGDWDLGKAVTLVYQDDRQASTAFQNNATPQAFAVDPEGVVVGKSVTNSAAAVEDLVKSIE